MLPAGVGELVPRRPACRSLCIHCCLQELVHLMPAMELRLLRLQPAMLAAWARDPGAVAARLLQLRSWMPHVDVSRLVVNR